MSNRFQPTEDALPSKRRRADTAERAYRVIRQLLVDFRLRPDERINEVRLAQTIGVSRTPVREALNRLASEGFVIFIPNKGFFFRALEIDDLLQLFELRAIIESGAFRLACVRGSDGDIAALENFWREALLRYAENDPDEILVLDETFHLRMAEISGNHEATKAIEGLNGRIRFVRRVQIELGQNHPRMVDEHTQLVAALRERDGERGSALLARHISMTFEDAKSAIKEAIFRTYYSSS